MPGLSVRRPGRHPGATGGSSGQGENGVDRGGHRAAPAGRQTGRQTGRQGAMDESMTYQGTGTAPRQAAGTTRAQEHALFGQTMGYVAVTTAIFALGAYLGRDLSAGVGLVAFIAAFAVLIGMRFAARQRELALALLGALGLLLGAAVGPTVAYYASMDPRAVWDAGGATALFIAAFGSAGY